jgi:hypothetical protein
MPFGRTPAQVRAESPAFAAASPEAKLPNASDSPKATTSATMSSESSQPVPDREPKSRDFADMTAALASANSNDALCDDKRQSKSSSTFLQFCEDYSVISLLALYDDDGRASSPTLDITVQSNTSSAPPLQLHSDTPNVADTATMSLGENVTLASEKDEHSCQSSESQDIATVREALRGMADELQLEPILRRRSSSLRLLLTGGQKLIEGDNDVDTSGDVVDWMEKQLK